MTTPASAAPHPPYATLLGFTRYVDRTGPAKATFVGGLRRAAGAPAPASTRTASSSRRSRPTSRSAPAAPPRPAWSTLVKPRWRPLYEALSAGATAYLHSLGDPSAVEPRADPRRARASLGDLPVKINPHFGLRYDDGRARGRPAALRRGSRRPRRRSLATLHLMARHMDQILPARRAGPGRPAPRRDPPHRPGAPSPSDVERWLAGEAAAFTRHVGPPPPDPSPPPAPLARPGRHGRAGRRPGSAQKPTSPGGGST